MTSHRFSAARPLALLASLAFVVCLGVGCNTTVQDKEWKGTGGGEVPGPIDEAKSLIQRYADGEELGSEAMTFDDLIQRATAADAGKGAKIKKFLEATSKKGVDASAAKALLKEL